MAEIIDELMVLSVRKVRLHSSTTDFRAVERALSDKGADATSSALHLAPH